MATTQKNLSEPLLRLYRINAGSCNGCDVELATTATVASFEVERIGCSYTESPAEANIVLVTGPLTVRVREKVLRAYGEVPEPKITVAVGVCPISGGVFRDSYAVDGPVDRYLAVDVNVPGCPPRPQAILAGVKEAVLLWRARRDGILPSPVASQPPPEKKTVSTGVRGKMGFNAAACVGCHMCEHVCAGGAIRFDEEAAGLSFTLWHNSCVFCGLCRHYCPTGALTVTDEWQMAHRQEQKYHLTTRKIMPYAPCSGCGEPLLPVAPELLRIAFRGASREIDRLKSLCTECRQKQSIGGRR